ncbi:MAG: prolyl oligopeptidase family serine peptidase [Candidatus Levybacteria bacterium]|nr:prolyl oligopeptidase family serine peptidase [Candidatus Levybacteria bacterium]
MKKALVFLCVILLIIITVESLYIFQNKWFRQNIVESIVKPKPIPKPLTAYTFENLKKTKFPKNQITLGPVISETKDFFSQMFYFSVPKTPTGKQMEKVSGLANIPKKNGEYPVIVMLRGFIPEESYKPGSGTQPSASQLVKSGFITLAPDFLGFGESASSSADAFEGRFQTYTTALTLLSSLPTLNSGLEKIYAGTISADLEKIGLWGHSNGGHIALSTLAISEVSYPTVLWSPVSKSFPYSILYYTDEYDDQGKVMRKSLSDFEKLYDAELFSPEKYYKWIKAPIEINQGTADQEVLYWWSDELVETLKENNIPVTYFTYPGANHNLVPSGWSSAVLNTIDFYKKEFNK